MHQINESSSLESDSFLAGPVVGPFGVGPFGLFPPENSVLAKFFLALSSGVIIGFLGFYFAYVGNGLGCSISIFNDLGYSFYFSLTIKIELLLFHFKWECTLSFLAFIRDESEFTVSSCGCGHLLVLFGTIFSCIFNKSSQKIEIFFQIYFIIEPKSCIIFGQFF